MGNGLQCNISTTLCQQFQKPNTSGFCTPDLRGQQSKRPLASPETYLWNHVKVLPRLFAKQLNDLETIIQSFQNPTKMQQTSKNHCKMAKSIKIPHKKSTRFWGFTAIIFMIFPYFHMPRYNRMSRDADSKGFKETWTAGLNRLGRGWFFSTKKPVIQLQVTRKPRKKTCLYVLLFFFSNLFRYFLIWLLLRGGHLVVGWLSKLRGRATPKGGR